jgi:hypothetical protein
MNEEAVDSWRPDPSSSQMLAPPPAEPDAPGFALPWVEQSIPPPPPPPPPGSRPRSRRVAGKSALAAIAIVIVVVAAKLLLFTGGARLISIATTQTYHEPTSIAGDSRSSDAAVEATVTQLQGGIELPALQGGHTEAAGYTDSQGKLDYLFLLAQDNGNDDSPRQGVSLNALFGGVDGTQLSTLAASSFNGIHLECATVTDASGITDVTLNACDWYNADAFGVFVDYTSASLSATQQLAASLLTAMTG